MKRKPYTFKLPAELIEQLKKESVNENRSLNNYVETILAFRKIEKMNQKKY